MELFSKIQENVDIPAVEAYETLRTNIRFCSLVEEVKTIAITSSLPDEGKTTTAINLAISMAGAGMKTLLVNTDLRQPAVEKMLGIENDIGITNYITREMDINDIIYDSGIKNFYLTPCGTIPPNPSELLGLKKFLEFIEKVRNDYIEVVGSEFDMVIFDTPPLGSVIDAAIIAAQTDGVILVVRSKTVSYKFVQEVKKQLEKANARILGIVLNKIRKKDYHYGYRYYNYYLSEENNREDNILKKLAKKIQIGH